MKVFTIGHSNHSFEAFSDLLRQHEIDVIADVRSTPFSRFNPHFNRNALHKMLSDNGMAYLFLGHELGGRPSDPSCYDENGRVQYNRLAKTPSFHTGVNQILKKANRRRIALMCSEKEPLNCHRTLLIAKALEERGVSVAHILADGDVENYQASLNRLIGILKLPPNGDMFRSRTDVTKEALNRWTRKMAFVDKKMANAQRVN